MSTFKRGDALSARQLQAAEQARKSTDTHRVGFQMDDDLYWQFKKDLFDSRLTMRELLTQAYLLWHEQNKGKK